MKSQFKICVPLIFKIAGIILIYVSNPLFSSDQTFDNEYIIKNWTIEDGLPTDTIRSIAQTPDGYLWIGTSRGLVLFDGQKFEPIETEEAGELPNKRRFSLFVDRIGILWIGSAGGLSKHENGKMTLYTAEEGLFGKGISSIFQDMEGDFWVGTYDGFLNRLARGNFEGFGRSQGLMGHSISVILESSRGSLYVGTMGAGLYEHRFDQFVKSHQETLGGKTSVTALYEDREGALWIGTTEGLIRIAGEDTFSFTMENGLFSNSISALLEDSEGSLWVGTVLGLNKIISETNGNYSVERYLEKNIVSSLFEDRERNIWVGSNGAGLIQLKKGIFKTYTSEHGLEDDYIVSLLEEESDIWIGSATGGLFRFIDGGFVDMFKETEAVGISESNWIKALGKDTQGNILLSASGKGLFRYRDGRFIQHPVSKNLFNDSIISIFCDSRGVFWFGTFEILIRYYDGHVESYSVEDGLAGKIVINIYEDKNNNLLIATSGGINFLTDGQFSEDHMEVYLQGVPVTAIHQDNSHTFWIGTRGEGLKRLKGGDTFSYFEADGLKSNTIYHLIEDERGNFWMSSDRGILRVSKSELNDFAEGKTDRINCLQFGMSDGLKSTECSIYKNAALKTSSGELWFATKRGVSVYNPDHLRMNHSPSPVVIIEKIFLDGKAIDRQSHIKFFRGAHSVGFHFTAPAFSAPERTGFKYKLEGYDKDWIFIGSGEERAANYEHLSPGDYSFRVQACSGDGIWSGNDSFVDFTIVSDFTHSALFKLFLVLGVLGIGITVYILAKRNGLKRLKKYKHSTLAPEIVEECLKRLTFLMETEKIYRDENLSLHSLSERLSFPPYQISQIINSNLNKSFSDLINGYRIEEVKEQLIDPQKKHLTIMQIAMDAGFNTKVAFNNAFKKFTRMTPSQFRNKYKKN